jgi:putative addiction module killer protein
MDITMQLITTDEFKSDLANVKDNNLKRLILKRLDRIEEYGEAAFGDWDTIKGSKNLYELIFDYGSGYRVYFSKNGNTVVLLLCGGIKKKQAQCIRRAGQIQERYKNENNQTE